MIITVIVIVKYILDEFQVNPKITVTDRDEGENARIRVMCSTKEKGSDSEACATFRVETDMVSIDFLFRSSFDFVSG